MSSSEGPKNLEIPDDLPSKLQIDQGAFLVGKTGERIYSIIWSEHAIKETKDDRQILPKFITVVEHEGWVWVKSQKANIYVLFAEESLPEEWRPAIEKTAKRLSTKMRHDGNPGPIEAQIINSNTLKGSSSVLEHGNFLAAEGSILRTNNVTKIETSRKLYRATLTNNPLDPELFQKWAIASQSLKGENPKMDLIMNEIQRRIDQQFEGPEN